MISAGPFADLPRHLGPPIEVISAHAEGEVGDVIIGGVPPPPGATLWEQRTFLDRDGGLRSLLLNEPRGGVHRHANLLVPANHPDAAMGFIIMEPELMPPMSGSNTICVATVLLECGLVPMHEPTTEFILEAPGGLVPIRAACANGRTTSVTLHNLPSFVCERDRTLTLPAIGTIQVDTVFGGDSFVVVNAADCDLALDPAEAHRIARIGMMITAQANATLGFRHPELDDWNAISFCLFVGPCTQDGDHHSTQTAVTIQPGRIDRSPTGTGVSALMALLHDRGIMHPGQTLTARSLIGATMTGAFSAASPVADRPAVMPEITGRAWITGIHQHRLDPDDPWPSGYRLSDTWGQSHTRTS